ncbi:hypothetical protein ACFO0N_09535 [Halobium salinum]|uniref:Uncharacterized protein n=1 Tax=Halobium salinum TaxID=1364940 RepID=A0ABD5PBY9_9EURY|nr:hypothetical protein [Halobium salinum]
MSPLQLESGPDWWFVGAWIPLDVVSRFAVTVAIGLAVGAVVALTCRALLRPLAGPLAVRLGVDGAALRRTATPVALLVGAGVGASAAGFGALGPLLFLVVPAAVGFGLERARANDAADPTPRLLAAIAALLAVLVLQRSPTAPLVPALGTFVAAAVLGGLVATLTSRPAESPVRSRSGAD